MGTAGHIDHGKTAIVKALTGIDCDTHKEEKRRGITINLGFAHLPLANGDLVGIVDVPGHRDFIHTMVAGAQGTDFVLMVIAANEGPMPQTREHLRICSMLGITRGIVAINKADLVNADRLAEVQSFIQEFTKGTFLEGCPHVPVSAKTGDGLRDLLRAVETIASDTQQRAASGVFRLYIDRIFSVSGFGTVVTGSVMAGSLHEGDTAWLLPDAKEVRVRRTERYGVETKEVVAGDRASLNLAGLSKEEFKRGMLVADRPLAPTILLDATVRIFPDAKALPIWSQAIFIMGTFEAQVKIHLLDTNTLRAGASALTQIHVPIPCIAQAQDAFVLRTSSGDSTIGGGVVIDPHPLHHRRRPDVLVKRLRDLTDGKLPMLAAVEIDKHPTGIERNELCRALNISPTDMDVIDTNGIPGAIVTLASETTKFYYASAHLEALAARAKKYVGDFHARHPLLATGRTLEEIQGALGFEHGDNGRTACLLLLHRLVGDGVLSVEGRTYALAGRSVSLSKEELRRCRVIEDFVLGCKMNAPVMAELTAHAKRAGIDEKQLRHILQFLASSRVLYPEEGTFLHASVVDKCRRALCDALRKEPDGLTVAQFRDLVAGNRKICLMLYALFDAEGITERKGDVRVRTKKGMELTNIRK
jgi:selenocysteine-specific elongation factor